MATLYLHVGTMKTGTTAIQSFMYKNAKKLRENGCLFPQFTPEYSNVQKWRNARWIASGVYDESVGEACFDKIADCAKKCPTIVMSDEGLYGIGRTGANYWRWLIPKLESRGIQLKVVVYLRRQDEYLQSFWAQKVKIGRCSDTFEDYAYAVSTLKQTGEHILATLNADPDYLRYLNRIAPVVGIENMIIRTYETSRFVGGSVVPDFFDAIGVEMSDEYCLPKSKFPNPTLKDSVLEYKRLLNNIPEYSEPKGYMSRALYDLQSRLAENGELRNRSGLTSEVRRAVLDTYEGSNARVARKYFGETEDNVLFHDLEIEKASEECVFDLSEIKRNSLMMEEIVENYPKIDISAADIRKYYEAIERDYESIRAFSDPDHHNVVERLRQE